MLRRFHTLTLLSCPSFSGLRNGKEGEFKKYSSVSCSWQVFLGPFLLIMASILNRSLFCVSGIHTLALLWECACITILGRSQWPPPCTASKMTGDPGAQMQHLVPPTGPASAECRLEGTGKQPFFLPTSFLYSLCSPPALLASWLTRNKLPFSLLPPTSRHPPSRLHGKD